MQRLAVVRHVTAGMGFLAGLIGFSGWLFGVPALTRLLSGLPTMKANTALCLVLLGAAYLIPPSDTPTAGRRIARVLLAVVAALTAATTLEWIADWDLGIDQLLFADSLTEYRNAPGRMSPATGACLLALALAGLQLRFGRYLAGQLTASAAAAVSLLVLVGYTFHPESISIVVPVSTMALHTAFGILTFSVAALFLQPNRGFMAIFHRSTLGGRLARRLLPAAVIVPAGLGWLRLVGQDLGYYDTAFGSALMVTLTTLLLGGLIYWSARELHIEETARTQVDAALREAESRYRRLFDESTIGLFEFSRDGRLLAMNARMARELGFESARAAATRLPADGFWSLFAVPEDAESFRKTLSGNGRVQRFEAEVRRADGETIVVSLGAAAIERPGGETVFEGSLENVSGVRLLEEQARQAQRLDAIGRLAGGVAHDLNNVLTVVLGYSSSLARQLPDADPIKSAIQEIADAGERASALTAQLLAFARKQVLRPTLVNVCEHIQEFSGLLERLIGERFELDLRLDPAAGVIRIDRSRFEQVLMNLVVNARDAMPGGGRIVVAAGAVELDESYTGAHFDVHPGRYALITVVDTGVGIGVEVRTRIFEPFFTTKNPGEGTGLGLATVYGIVRQSGGHIWVYSEPNHGTEFKVYLPQVEAGVEEPKNPAEPMALGGDENVLIVEDDPSVRRFLEVVLSAQGYRTQTASRFDEAVEILRETERVDVLLTDIVLPDRSGVEIAREAGQRHPGVRTVFISGASAQTYAEGFEIPPGAEFVPKPVTERSLLAGLRAALRQRSVEDASA